MKEYEAQFYEKIEKSRVKCGLCPHNCVIGPDDSGICGVRTNINGTLITRIYGRLTSTAMDPIEKKPLYHFYPGSDILSIGTKGCNLKCPYCQNWHISQDITVKTSYYSSEDVIEAAKKENSIGIAYTYSEPVIWFEYIMDTARVAGENSLKNVMVTNGFINKEPLDELLTVVDAMNIDLKCFREETYKKVQKGKLENVKETIRRSHEKGCHIEITTLIVTGINDTLEEMIDIIDFISKIDKDIPWHISRYYPSYKYNESSTNIQFMMDVYSEAVKKLNYVYTGNVPANLKGSATVCPSCGKTAVSRSGYHIRVENLKGGNCLSCGEDLNIVNK